MDSPFEVRLTRNAEKDLLGLRDLTERATNEILVLKQNPYKGHPLKGSLRGARALEFSLKGVAYRAAHVAWRASAFAWYLWWVLTKHFMKRLSAGLRH